MSHVCEVELAEERLRERALLASVLEATDAMVFSVDVALNYTSFNAAHAAVMKALYGATIELGRPIFDYQTNPADAAIGRRNLLRALEGERFTDVGYSGAEGRSRRFFEVAHAPVRSGAGQVVGATVFARDVTDRHLAVDLRKQLLDDLARSNRELEQFAYVASHDLQEPLRMVTSYLQLLERRLGPQLAGEEREFLDFAVDGGRRMQALIGDLLQYSRLGRAAVPARPVDSGEALSLALANLEVALQESGASVVRGALPAVLVDQVQLVQLFQNLVGNAVKFRAARPPRVEIGAVADGDRWRFSVKDNGIGIAPQDAEAVFTIFRRLHTREQYPGTGIGLAIAKRVVERHGGRIWVESVPGEGATFCFTLPGSGA